MSFPSCSRWLAVSLTVLAVGLALPARAADQPGSTPASQPAASQPTVQEESLPAPVTAPVNPEPVAAAPATQPVQIVVVSAQQLDLAGKVCSVDAVLKPRYNEWEMVVEYSVRTRFDAGALGIPLELRLNALVDKALARDRRWNPLTTALRLETPTSVIKPLLFGKTWYCYKGKVSIPYPYFLMGRYDGISLLGTLVIGDQSGVVLDQKKGDLSIQDRLGGN